MSVIKGWSPVGYRVDYRDKDGSSWYVMWDYDGRSKEQILKDEDAWLKENYGEDNEAIEVSNLGTSSRF